MDRCGPTYSITAVLTQKLSTDFFNMYPKDVAPDADGKDLNAKPDGTSILCTPDWE